MAIAAGTFAGVFLLLVGLYWIFVLRPETVAARALERQSKPIEPKKRRIKLTNPVTRKSTVPILEEVLHRSAAALGPTEHMLEQSGLSFTLGRLVLATAFLAVLAFALVARVGAGLLIATIAALLCGSGPYLVVRMMAQRRIGKFEEQFPEAIALIARALRAGHALPTGLGMVAEEMPEPTRTEFKLLHDRQNYGMPLPDALRAFAERVPLLDARFFATAVLTQRESGGNLAEVLDGLAAIIRDRFRLKRQVRVVSAHGRITGTVLLALPLVVGAILYYVAPAQISLLFTDSLGKQMVGGALVLQAIGFLIIRRIVTIEV